MGESGICTDIASDTLKTNLIYQSDPMYTADPSIFHGNSSNILDIFAQKLAEITSLAPGLEFLFLCSMAGHHKMSPNKVLVNRCSMAIFLVFPCAVHVYMNECDI